jgi:hypothetical protein
MSHLRRLLSTFFPLSMAVVLPQCSGAASSRDVSDAAPPPFTGDASAPDATRDAATCSAAPPLLSPSTFFVSPTGKDSNSGSMSSPWATIAHAQKVIQATSKSAPSTVYLRGGTYYVGSTLSFGAVDSGTQSAPVTWAAYPCEVPVVSGGARVAAWRRGAGNLWTAELPASTVPFESLFYNGDRRLRARLQSTSGIGYAMQGGKCAAVNPPKGDTTPATTADCNLGTFLRIAGSVSPGSTGCPYASSGTESKCLDRFEYAASDPITTWDNVNGVYTGDPSKPCMQRPGNTSPAGDVEVTVFNAWTVDVLRVACVDTTNRIVYFTGAAYGQNGTQYPFFGLEPQHRYIVENAKEAFDAEVQSGQTGIWFVDRSSSPWVLSYAANPGEDPRLDTVEIPQVPSPFVSANGLANTVFRGITFEMDDYVPTLSGFTEDDNGENALPAAVDCEGCANVDFDAVTIRRTSTSGLELGGSAGNATCALPAGGLASPACIVVENSAFYDLGDSGIHVGHKPSGADKDDTVVSRVRVENNLVTGYSRVFADGEGFAQGNGHDVLYTHNDITDGYHAGISVCQLGCPSGGGGDFNVVSSYNRIWNTMQGITSDGGTLYYNTGGAKSSATGNQIIHNVVHDTSDASILDKNGVINVSGSGYGGEGLYLDIQTGDVTVSANVVYRVSAHAMWITGGPAPNVPANRIENNVLAFARDSSFALATPWGDTCPTSPALRASLEHNVFYFDRDESSDPAWYPYLGCAFACGFPFVEFEAFQGNDYWGVGAASGFATDGHQFHTVLAPLSEVGTACQSGPPLWTFMSWDDWRGDPTFNGSTVKMEEDPGSVLADPGFANAAYPHDDYTLANPPVTGFDPSQTNDTLQNAGRSAPQIAAPVVARTFPTYSFNPSTDF